MKSVGVGEWTDELRRESEREIKRSKEWIKNSVGRSGGGRCSLVKERQSTVDTHTHTHRCV